VIACIKDPLVIKKILDHLDKETALDQRKRQLQSRTLHELVRVTFCWKCLVYYNIFRFHILSGLTLDIREQGVYISYAHIGEGERPYLGAEEKNENIKRQAKYLSQSIV
ncbi:MAG: hypothetical protein GY705_14865, partial [Bacteroidetes bacterium]|nr:hypothetical protein [Bacteroidota bacterium]